MRRENVVLLICALAFLGLAAEIRYEHRLVLERLQTAWIPIVYCGIGALACLMGMAKTGFFRTLAQYLLALGIGVSAAGIYLHTSGDLQPYRVYLDVWTKPGSQVMGNWPPVFPPLAIAGLAVIALAACWNGKRAR